MTTTRDRARGAKRLLAGLALAGAALAGGGCDRAHLSPYYGHSYDAWFTAQHVRHEPADSEPTRRALSSLDAQEAAAISKNYRHTVGANEGGNGQGQMVMTGQGRGPSNEGYVPPPSVPGGQ